MMACIHQPNYLPWLGFFGKVLRSDAYLVMDNVQFPKNCWTNRVRIAGSGEPPWLTVPVCRSGLSTLISEAEISYTQNWVEKHLKTVQQVYRPCRWFSDLYPPLAAILESRPQRLVDLNIPLIRLILDWCGITTPLILGSTLTASGKASDLVVSMCRSVGATAYLAGEGAADYENLEVYGQGEVEYYRFRFRHPEYPQRGRKEFCPGLSIIDALFNCGPEATRQMLADGGAIVRLDHAETTDADLVEHEKLGNHPT
jgi:hypothetical protein